MRINSINPFYINYNKCSEKPLINRGLNCDVFEKSISFEGNKKNSYNPFGVDKSCIEKSKNQDAVFKFIGPLPYGIVEVSYPSVHSAIQMKEYFDEEYGKDGWAFVSIGTSPAGIGKALEFMGEDVRYVPISDLRYLSDRILDIYKMNPKKLEEKIHTNYKKYLDNVGINKEKIEKDKKHYIICDYAHNGTTLKIADHIMGEVFKIDRDRYSCLNIEEIKDKYCSMYNKNPKIRDCMDQYMEYCSYSEIEPYVGIPHIPYNELDKIDEEMKKGKSNATKGFELMLCHRLRNAGVIK